MTDIVLLPLPEADDSVENHAQWPIVIASDVWLQKSVQDYARACVVHAASAKDAEIEALRAKTAVTMGVGTGDGKLFVHGDHESIKAAQAIVLQRDALRAEVAEWKRVASEQAELHGEAEARAERLAEAGCRVTAAFRALGEATAWTRAAEQARHECEAAMLALDAALRDHDQEGGDA